MTLRRHLARVMLKIAAGALVLGSSEVLHAQSTASAQGDAWASVILPLTVVREMDLDFGTVAILPDSGGSVTVTALTGAVAYAGGASGVCGAACTPAHPARFVVSGEPGRSYAITVPSRLAIAPAGGDTSGSVMVHSLTVLAASSPAGPHGILSAEGRDQFDVGGILELPANAALGRYTTQVPVIVDYL